MSPTTRTRAAIAMLIYVMTNVALFVAGLVIALVASRFGRDVWIPVVVLASLVLAAPLAWEAISRLRARPRRSQSRYEPITLRTQWQRDRR